MPKLLEELIKLNQSDEYPLHMPGHKRNMKGNYLENAYNIDITEIEGYDNLYESQGILKDARLRAAKVFGADNTYFLVNGSTVGILTAIYSTTNKGGKVLVARNCHKSVYHAIELQELQAVYVYPPLMDDWQIADSICPTDVDLFLKKEKGIEAVIITSPTYEGVVSDITKIADIVHSYNIPLIVDEAHGSHFSFHERFPKSSIYLGADIVVQSIHKTLPSFTQTALLHVNGKRINYKKVEKYLSFFQSSSPSYLLMSGIDNCISLIEERGSDLWKPFFLYRDQFINQTSKLEKIRIFNKNICCDPCKVIISVLNTSITGRGLQMILLKQYHLQVEMAAQSYVVVIITLSDLKECFDRLTRALLEIELNINKVKWKNKRNEFYLQPEIVYTVADAVKFPFEEIDMEDAKEKIAAEYINLYPPGIPIVAPGELITRDIINRLLTYETEKLHIQGMQDKKVKVIKNEYKEK